MLCHPAVFACVSRRAGPHLISSSCTSEPQPPPPSTFAHTVLGAFLALCAAAAFLAKGAFASLAHAGASTGAGTTSKAEAGFRVHSSGDAAGFSGQLDAKLRFFLCVFLIYLY